MSREKRGNANIYHTMGASLKKIPMGKYGIIIIYQQKIDKNMIKNFYNKR